MEKRAGKVVLIAGATGFIGTRLSAACVHAGDTVVCASRDTRSPGPNCTHRIALDYESMPSREELIEILTGVDVVVNSVGILRERRGQTFEKVHASGPVALFEACVAAGVKRIVQISALGAEEGAAARYHVSKARADAALKALPIDWVIVQPSLIYGAGGSSAQLFEFLASLPVIPLPGDGEQHVQPVHVQDVTTALLTLIHGTAASRQVVPMVGPAPASLRGFLVSLRAGLGLPPTRTVRMPSPLMRAAAAVGDHVPGMMLDRETLGMLTRGSTGDPAPLSALLGRPAQPISRFVAPERRAERGVAASLRWLAPLLRFSVAAMWFIAAIVSIGPYPVEKSLALLVQVGIPPGQAVHALAGAALLDFVFGVATLWPRRSRALWNAQLFVVLAYTAIITVRLPHLWLDPFGPIAKNLPILVMLLALRELEDRR
ncbi:MAG TPA: SDR family oxidoreductase [Steroidobacteraceae bacterium]|nr:SDR family oxidoreductase [Steroidobacteraceae bacterium]